MTNEEELQPLDEKRQGLAESIQELMQSTSPVMNNLDWDMKENTFNLEFSLVDLEDENMSTFGFLNQLTNMNSPALIHSLAEELTPVDDDTEDAVFEEVNDEEQ